MNASTSQPPTAIRKCPASAHGQAYVRITRVDDRGFLEFQFSLGDPNLFLEMTLPRKAFDEFCEQHQARHLSAMEAQAVDEAENKWRFGDVAN